MYPLDNPPMVDTALEVIHQLAWRRAKTKPTPTTLRNRTYMYAHTCTRKPPPATKFKCARHLRDVRTQPPTPLPLIGEATGAGLGFQDVFLFFCFSPLLRSPSLPAKEFRLARLGGEHHWRQYIRALSGGVALIASSLHSWGITRSWPHTLNSPV